ncbi:hypothetical protein acsn021_12410 [Anaerocolumna cellulosilytica]|uniref:Uncharacterized protein n=1 Tax=Anaerocolumna cellulosilytica TaxID=433286 RepID=A0A6S6R2F9_9FIRM|nr:GNAT family N-acetyltransferase [Anaerocolumna cellulosilytica]MBB5196025.1 ribosomal protein S18 acetylase RimI-like enzyme [Anaerocolumna cellulosilytica]BCJ93672.1 hypothetical protein acsn021_12410 [Anaerocolumna cellulosilytica]
MTETDLLEIQSKLADYTYSSMQYLEHSDVSQYEVILKRDGCILLYGFNEKEGCHEYHFAANTPDDILKEVQDNQCLITFVPEEWITEFEKAGFVVCAAFCDYFMDSLEDALGCGEPEFLKRNECKEAADVTIACRGQSRGFHGETTEWITDWIDTSKDAGCDLEYLHRALLIERNEQAEIVGIVVTALYGFESEKGAVSWIREVAVKPAYQRKGIARKLITQALHYGKNHGARRAFLAADACNIHAIHLYESIGFRAGKDKQINMIR